MATVKGKYKYVWGEVEVRFTVHLLCDDASPIATCLLNQVGHLVQDFTDSRDYALQDILENRALIERVLMESKFNTTSTCASAPVSLFASKIDLEFTQIVEKKPRSEAVVLSPPPEPVVREVINYIDRPEPPKKTIADKIKDDLEQKIIRFVSVSDATAELLERYEPQMKNNPELRARLTRFLEKEEIDQFDQYQEE